MMALLQEDKSPFKLAYLILKYVGFMNEDSRPWSLVYTMVPVLSCIYLLTCSSLDLILGHEEFPEIVAALSALSISLHVNGKIFKILWNQTEIRQLIVRMEKLRQENLHDNDRKHFILSADEFSIKVALFYGIVFTSCPIFSIILNITFDIITGSGKPYLILQIWVPWSITDFRTYLVTTVFVAICTLLLVAEYLAFSSFIFIFTFEMSAYLQVLQSRLETMKLNDKNVCRQHIEIIELLRDYGKLFSGQLYMEIFLSSIQPCGFGYAFIKAIKKHDIRAFDFIYKFIVAIITPCVVCTCGQEISTQLEKLHHSSYMCKWYEEKPENRRYLMQVMTATLKPPILGFRQMVYFNYACYATVVQGIYSYLMMVNQFDSE